MRRNSRHALVEELMGDDAGQLFLRLLGRHVSQRFYVDETTPDLDEAETIGLRTHFWIEWSKVCESPIEKILFAHLLFIDDGYKVLNSADYPYTSDHVVTVLEPQGKVGSYHADFLITIRLKHLVSQLVVECDGHEFHERTKQQAAHDRARDRAMTKAGIRILRYTGSEVFRDANKCADEIEEMVGDIRADLERSYGADWPPTP